MHIERHTSEIFCHNSQNGYSRRFIKAASEGDAQAIQSVLKHYEGYIVKLSTRKMYDEFGQTHYCVDETLRRRLETKLIAKTLAFRPVPYKGMHV